MPSPKRWFPCSRDLNDDHELWDFTQQHGDRALRTWLEILSQLDKTENHLAISDGWFASLSRKVRQSVANLRRQIRHLTATGWLTNGEPTADDPRTILSSHNYWKYHKSWESKRITQNSAAGTYTGPPLPILSEPSEEKISDSSAPKDSASESVPVSSSSILTDLPNQKSSEHEAGHKKRRRRRAPALVRSSAVWEAYAASYQQRYGVPPVRHAGVNAMLCKVIDKLGAEEAPLVAAFYLTHNKPLYVQSRHPTTLLLRDAEGLRTEWATGVKATTCEARNLEQHDAAREQIKRVQATMERRRKAREGGGDDSL